MADTVEIEYVNHTAEHSPGDTKKLNVDEARKLVQSGMAQYAPPKAEKKAEHAKAAEKK